MTPVFSLVLSFHSVPGFKREQMALAEKGIDEIIVFCVNDAAVMKAWADSQGIDKKGIITFMADTSGALTKALGMEITHPGVCGVLGGGRCKRLVRAHFRKGVYSRA
jgi:peroxiredoxin